MFWVRGGAAEGRVGRGGRVGGGLCRCGGSGGAGRGGWGAWLRWSNIGGNDGGELVEGEIGLEIWEDGEMGKLTCGGAMWLDRLASLNR